MKQTLTLTPEEVRDAIATYLNTRFGSGNAPWNVEMLFAKSSAGTAPPSTPSTSPSSRHLGTHD